MNYKTEFVKGFAELFKAKSAVEHHGSHGVIDMDFDEKEQVVTIYFEGGGKKKVNVYGDSLSAIAVDVVRHGLW